LQEYANEFFTKPDKDIQVKYSKTRSIEVTELEINAFSICKGLLARLNPGNISPKKTFPCNELAPYSAKWICSYKSKCEPANYIVKIPVAYIIVPLFDKNNYSVTLELKPGRKKSKQVTCPLNKGDAYIVHCKNHVDKKSKNMQTQLS
jgi:hypothetical protein